MTSRVKNDKPTFRPYAPWNPRERERSKYRRSIYELGGEINEALKATAAELLAHETFDETYFGDIASTCFRISKLRFSVVSVLWFDRPTCSSGEELDQLLLSHRELSIISSVCKQELVDNFRVAQTELRKSY